jgi:hypothetical protein
MVEQCRYLTDFETNRLVRVVAFSPWWGRIFEPWWDSDDEALTAEAERIQAAGWRIVTTEDDINMTVGETRAVYQAPESLLPGVKSLEYHGTTSDVVMAAFPQIDLPEPPFPVREPTESHEPTEDEDSEG